MLMKLNKCLTRIPRVRVNQSQLISYEPERVVQIKQQIAVLHGQLMNMSPADPRFDEIAEKANSLYESIPLKWRDYPD